MRWRAGPRQLPDPVLRLFGYEQSRIIRKETGTIRTTEDTKNTEGIAATLMDILVRRMARTTVET